MVKLKEIESSEENLKILTIRDLKHRQYLTGMESVNKQIEITSNGRVRPSKYLEGMYELSFDPGIDIVAEINRLLQFDNVIYAEPVYRESLFFVPNDPQASPSSGNQDHLSVINAYDAWDINQGQPDISVAVIDTGTDLDHPDLIDNLRFNTGDPVNGIDDDGDGLIDNFNGFDFADDDNDATADQDGHGVLVTGLSSATTNNGNGVAGAGFNSTFVPYKIFQSSDGFSNNCYVAVLYAAQHHDVLNLSWGGQFFSMANQDVINAAVLEHDAVIVAAAGNTPEELEFYPASYENVLSVASTNLDDTKYAGSTFSYNVDIAAPGASNYTTVNGGAFGFSGPGTSFASPLVAGAAALLRAHFPEMTAQQIMEQLRVSSEDIYDVGSNQDFFGRLGKGRLDMFNALTSNNKSVRLLDFDYSDPFGGFAFYSDTVTITGEFENFLSPTSNAIATLSTQSPYATLLTTTFDLGPLNALETVDFQNDPVTLILSEDTPPDEQILIRIDYTDGDYNDWQFVQFRTTPDHINFLSEEIGLTVAGNGNLGYASEIQNNGLGFEYRLNEIASQLGLIISVDGTIIDNALTDLNTFTREQDFATHKNIRLFNNSTADQFGISFFDDSNAASNEFGLFIEQKILGWDRPGSDPFFIIEYRVSNKSATDITDLKLATFIDWRINNYQENQVEWDNTNKLGYAFRPSDLQIFGGTALLTSQNPIFYAIDVGSENGNTSELTDSFTKSLKSNFITSGLAKTQAGLNGGNDVAQLQGAELGGLAVGESVKVAFMIGATDDLITLQQAISSAQTNYSEFLANPPVATKDTTCTGQPAVLTLNNGASFDFYSDPQGQDLLHSGNNFTTGILDNDTTFYIQNTDEVYKSDIRALRVVPMSVAPDVVFPTDLLFLGDFPNNAIQFEDQTFKATQWQWDFDNGSGSTDDNPIAQFHQVGDYQVTLMVTNKFGCTAQFSKMLSVRERGPVPSFPTYRICPGESVQITSNEGNNLRIYTSEESTTHVGEGMVFDPGTLLTDTIFYISNTDEEFESIKVAVPVDVHELSSAFEIRVDTTDLTNKNLLQLVDLSIGASNIEWTFNNQSLGEEATALLDITGEDQFTVQLTAHNNLGCSLTSTKTMTPMESAQPTANAITICEGATATIKPTGGSLFYFYADQQLSNLVKKGTQYETNTISSDTTFYVTGIDSFIESPAVEVAVNVVESTADFIIEPNPVILDDTKQIALIDQSVNAVSWSWFSDGSLIETTQNPLLTIDSIGDFAITLQIGTEDGCTFSKTRVLSVQNVTAIESTEPPVSSIYPNPVDGQLIIETIPGDNWEAHLYDLTGNKLALHPFKGGRTAINMSTYQSGLYTLILSNGEMIERHRILVR